MTDQRRGGISWTDETWNPIRGCQRVNPDCINCYAERIAATRLSGQGRPYEGLAVVTPSGPRWTGSVMLDWETLIKPLSWTRPRLVFVNGMSDLFIDKLSDTQIDQVVAVMALCPQHTFQVLTKRPERMAVYLSSESRIPRLLKVAAAFGFGDVEAIGWPLPNVWWGVSMGHQAAADRFLRDTIRCRDHAAVLWVSAEPMWELLDLYHYFPREVETGQTTAAWVKGIDWVVGGGESGPNARPCPPAAARRLRDDCIRYGVPFHWKQWGEFGPTGVQIHPVVTSPEFSAGGHRGQDQWVFPGGDVLRKVGKREAGRLLDGLLWDQYPGGFER